MLQLYYNSAPSGGLTLYNGNISGMKWGTASKPDMLYRFTYDGANRLTGADFYNTGYTSTAFDCTYGYDSNGNVTSIVRKGTTGATIDNLTYNYNGNKINYVNDASGDYASTVDYPGDASSSTFAYDQNGNMEYEPSKGISLLYNLLNLPEEADFGTNRKINYFYTFDGQKVRQTVEDNGTLTKTDYCGPFVYETASGTRSLKYIVTPEGRAVKSGSSWNYEYNLTDHLGNVRAVIRKGSNGLAELIQQKHYYPFGMEMSTLSSGASTNKYLYNGKEYQDDFDLGWYDYGARFYDPELGRFHTQDAFAEKYYDLSPYQYAANNPILFLDFNGDSIVINGSEQFTKSTNAALDFLKQTETGLKLYNALQNSDNIFTITETSGGNGFKSDSYGEDDSQKGVSTTDSKGNVHVGTGKGSGGEILFNATNRSGPIDENGKRDRDPAIALGHEMGHAEDANNGTMDRGKVNGLKYTEWVATHKENQIRSEHGLPLRKYYGIVRVTKNGQVVGIRGKHQLINGTTRAIDSSYDYRKRNPSK